MPAHSPSSPVASDPVPLPPRPWSGWLGRILILVALVWFAASSAPPSGDGRARFDAIDALLTDGTVSEMRHSILVPLFATPLWCLGSIFESPAWWCSKFNVVIFVLGLVVLHRLLRDRISDTVRHYFVFLLTFASMFPLHIETFYGEVFTAVLMAVGLLALSVRQTVGGWTCVVLAVANTPAALGGLLIPCGYLLLRTRRLRWVILMAVCTGVILLESYVRHGDAFSPGYESNRGFTTVLPYSGQPGFSYPLLFGLISILFSFGKGLFFYAPGLLLPPAIEEHGATSEVTRTHTLWLLFTLGLVLTYAKWWSWYGGWFWGPRFFLFACFPACLALAANLAAARTATLLRNLLTLVVLSLSFWVGLNGKVFGQANLGIATENNFAMEALVWYTPEFSALWRPFVDPKTLSSEDWVFCALFVAGYLYAATPVCIAILRRSREVIPKWFHDHLSRKDWAV